MPYPFALAPAPLPSVQDLLGGFVPAPGTPGMATLMGGPPMQMTPPAPTPNSMMAQPMAGSPPMPTVEAPSPPPAPFGFHAPGYRPTSGIALGPQSAQEQVDLADEVRQAMRFLDVAGYGPLNRAGRHFSEGRPLEGAGNIALAMLPYRPLAGAGLLGGTYAGALASDLGLFGGPSSARAQDQPKDPRVARIEKLDSDIRAAEKAIADLGRRTRDPDRLEVLAAPHRSRLERLSQERGALQAAIDAQAAQRVEQEASLSGQKKQQDQAEYDRQVKAAEEARDAWFARDRRFSDTRVGRLADATGGAAPFGFGGLVGLMSRAATGGGRALYNYGLPLASGAAAGVTAANLPLVYNSLYTEPDNPRRRGWEAMLELLPPGHPRRAEFQALAQSLPQRNPLRQEATEQLYDPTSLAERSTLGAVEGLLGGLAGSELWRIPSRLSGLRGGTPPAPLTPAPPPPPPPRPPGLPPGAYQNASGRWVVMTPGGPRFVRMK